MVKTNMDNANIKTGTYFYDNEFYDFEFSTTLSARDKITFVNSVVDTIVGDNYNSIIKDMIFDYTLIQTFTNIDTSFINNSNDIVNAVEQFLNETNIVDIIKANMEFGLLELLGNAVDKAIEYRTGIRPSPLNDALASLLSSLEKRINEIDLGDMMGIAQKFMGMTDEFTPESIVNAYINSDMHKNNLIEIEEEKGKRDKKNEIQTDEDLDEAVRVVANENKVENDDKKLSKSNKSKK